MGGASKYILILGLGFVLGYQFTGQSERVSSAIEAGMASKSSVTKQFERILAKESEDKIFATKTYESFRSQDEAKTDLSSYSFHDLSLALKNKSKKFREENIKQIELSEEESESKKVREEVFEQLAGAIQSGGAHWKSSAEISLGGDRVDLEITAKFYGAGTDDYDEGIDLSKLKDTTICWIALFFMDYKDKKIRMSTSDCTARAYKNNTYYMTMDTIQQSEVNQLIYHMMIPFPQSQVEIEFLTPNDKTWHTGSVVSWSPISKEEYDKLNEARKDYSWAY